MNRTSPRSGGDKNRESPHRLRLQRLRQAMSSAGLDGLLVCYPPDQFYLTGAVLEDSAVVVSSRSVLIVTDSRFDEQVRRQTPWASIRLRSNGLMDAVAGRVNDLVGLRVLGIQGEYLPVAMLRRLTGKLDKARTRLTSRMVANLRSLKDSAEIELIEQAVRISERAWQATVSRAKAGATELEIAAELEHQMRLAGAAGPTFAQCFEPIVAAGARSSLPHARPTSARIARGAPLLFDWGARVGGYFADLTRVVSVGRPASRLRGIHAIVLEAQQAGIESVRPGASCREVDAAARNVITRAGYGKRFGHGLGHGIGLDIHEAPRLSARSEDTLAAGMVVTVEPGIYLPGVGGVRIEDDVLVTETGCRVLSKLDRALIQL